MKYEERLRDVLASLTARAIDHDESRPFLRMPIEVIDVALAGPEHLHRCDCKRVYDENRVLRRQSKRVDVRHALRAPRADYVSLPRRRCMLVDRNHPAGAEPRCDVDHLATLEIEVRVRCHDRPAERVPCIGHGPDRGECVVIDDELAVAFSHRDELMPQSHDVDVGVVGDARDRLEDPLQKRARHRSSEGPVVRLAAPGIARGCGIEQARTKVDARVTNAEGVHHPETVEPVLRTPAARLEDSGTCTDDLTAQPVGDRPADRGWYPGLQLG